MITITKKKSRYELYFTYDSKIVDYIKSLDDRKYDSTKKMWEMGVNSLYTLLMFCKKENIPFNFTNISLDKMRELFIKNKEDMKKLIEDKKNLIERNKQLVFLKKDFEDNYFNYENQIVKNLINIKFYPYQVACIKYMSEIKSGLISLQPGLGKTIISIAYCIYNNIKKVLVITPNSLKYNFLGEIEKFTNKKGYILNNKNNDCLIEEATFIIVNYEYFNSSNFDKKEKIDNLKLDKVNTVIMDEAHRIKNVKSNTYKNIKKSFDKIDRKLFLTGTPAPNKINELYPLLNLINKLDFPNQSKFNEEFCGMVYDKYNGWIMVSPPDLEGLFNRLNPYTYRKRKEDVLKDLPSKSIQIIPLRMRDNEYKTYKELEDGVINDLENNFKKITNPLTIMLRLKEYTSGLKSENIIDLIEGILDSNEKVVVVDFFKKTLETLHNKYKDISVLHTGDYTDIERNEMKNRFMEDDNCKIFFGTTSTTKEGLTLTKASKMIILTQSFSVGEDEQIQDRIHRIGAKNNVTIYYPCFKNTIDDVVFYVVQNKKKNILKAIDNIDYKNDYQQSIIEDIIKKIKEKK